MQRFRGKKQESMHLCDGAVDAPAGSHLAPVEYELLFNRRKWHRVSGISVITEITALKVNVVKGLVRAS
jgi:hypothetical protein